MRLQERIDEQLKIAMKTKYKPAINALRSLKAAITTKVKLTGRVGELSESEILKTTQTSIKQRKDSLKIFKDHERYDLARIEEEEIQVLSVLLPVQLTEEELSLVVKEVINDTGAHGRKDLMGVTIKLVRQAVGATADGKAIATAVKEQLSK
jgi:uncharacterized protein YqeY